MTDRVNGVNVRKLSAAADCVRWTSYSPQNSLNAVNVAAYTTLTDCLDFCASQRRCVAVDFTTAGSPCWLHFDAAALLPENTYRVEGITQFIINRQCSSNRKLPQGPLLSVFV